MKPRRLPWLIVLLAVLAIVSWASPLVNPRDPSTLMSSGKWEWLTVAGFICWLFVIFTLRKSPDKKLSRGDAERMIGFLCLAVFVAHYFPIAAMALNPTGSAIFEPSCNSPTTADFAWLAIDSFAKGALIDFMESFNIDLFTCGPKKGSLVASSFVFAMRLYSTYVVVWIIVKMWARVKKRVAKSIPEMRS